MIRVTPHITLIKGSRGATFPYSNSLFVEARRRVLIDTGVKSKVLKEFAGDGIDMLFNSHYHFDHIRNNRIFKDVPLYAHNLDAPAIMNEEEFFSFTGIDKGEGGIFEGLDFHGSRVDTKLDGDEAFDLGGVKMRVLHTPGHTPGHCVYHFFEVDVLFLVDIDLKRFGPFYGHHSSDLEDFIGSITRVIDLRPKRVITGHMPHVIEKGVNKRLEAYLSRIWERDERILNILERPRTLQEIVEAHPIYLRQFYPKELLDLFEGNMVKGHLDRLVKTGEVVEEDGNYIRKG